MNRTVLALLILVTLPGTASFAADKSIVQAGQAFSETDLTVAAGTHLKFLNQDDVKHNILVQTGDDDDDAKDMGIQSPGQTIDVPMDKAGRYTIRCHIHPNMKMNVTVN
jgi:cytochrome c peroxidase